MDHLEKAKDLAITGEALVQDGDQLANLAVLHALIAIAEGLNSIISPEQSGRKSLDVHVAGNIQTSKMGDY